MSYQTWVGRLADNRGELTVAGYLQQFNISFNIRGVELALDERFVRRIPSWKARLQTDWGDEISRNGFVSIDDSPEVYAVLFYYLESDGLKPDGPDIFIHLKEILRLSYAVGFSQFGNFIVSTIKNQLTAENILRVYQIAFDLENENVHAEALGLACLEYVRLNFEVIKSRLEFRHLPSDVAHAFLIDMKDVGIFGGPDSPLQANEVE